MADGRCRGGRPPCRQHQRRATAARSISASVYARERERLSQGGDAPPEPSNLAIEVGGEADGAIGYVAGIDVERYSAEIGYWLGETYWGRGIVTEALVLVTDYVFDA